MGSRGEVGSLKFGGGPEGRPPSQEIAERTRKPFDSVVTQSALPYRPSCPVVATDVTARGSGAEASALP